MSTEPGLQHRIRAAIKGFLQERLQARLDKLKPEDPKRNELLEQFQPAAWLEDAARRVKQIQAVTHSLKAIHPDAKGTNLYVEPVSMASHTYVGTHVLGEYFAGDVVGNAAALDVYKFLKLEVDGRSLLDWFLDDEPQALAALADDVDAARALQAAFVGLTQEREGPKSTHSRAKQIYWLVGEDAADNSEFHLLAPLYATSLAHAVHAAVQEDRFGEASRAAWAARQKNEMYDGAYREHRGLAAQRLGGTKPQNISQLNSERGGLNYLLASLPPLWKKRVLRQPWGVTSVIDRILLHQPGVRQTLEGMIDFLLTDPPNNVETRDRRDDYVSQLIDELVNLGQTAHQTWLPGWSADSRCVMVVEEQLWLDPGRVQMDDDFRALWLKMDWPDQIGQRFANWLNARLQRQLPVGEVEHRHWKRELLLDELHGGWAQPLHEKPVVSDTARPVSTPEAAGG